MRVLTDIEGTTSSISFVKDVLFPYARAQLPAFVAAHGGEPEVRRWLDQVDGTDDAARVATLQRWIDEDRKHTALKALQGMLWKDGYASGAYRAHVYDDAVAALRAWHAAGHALLVYSSGSVPAQKLLFAHSEAGDLTPLFTGYYDTEVGGKRESSSYARIVAAAGGAAGEWLFLSDVVEELDAARIAGLATVLVDRRADHPAPRTGEAAHGHTRVETFAAIRPSGG